jgi:hypothetical protein
VFLKKVSLPVLHSREGAGAGAGACQYFYPEQDQNDAAPNYWKKILTFMSTVALLVLADGLEARDGIMERKTSNPFL